jgi:ABC-type Mn2+/Zn2+ transport system permease subunit
VLLGSLLALMGIFVVLRRMAFMSDGIAHASLSGVAAGLLLGTNPLYTAIFFAAVFATIIALLERRTKLSSDAIIGLIFTSGMALGIVLLSFDSGYRPELTSYLFGNILSLQWSELVLMVILGAFMSGIILARYRQLALFILNQETAYVHGVRIERYRLLLYIGVSVAVVLGMKLLGIILVSALLIIPVTTAKIVAKSFRSLMLLSVLAANLAVVVGLLVAAELDLPPGATIILCGMAIFGLAAVFKKFRA